MLQAFARAVLAGTVLGLPAAGRSENAARGSTVWTQALAFGAVAWPDPSFGAAANAAHWAAAERAWIAAGAGFTGGVSTQHLALTLPVESRWRLALGAGRMEGPETTPQQAWNLAFAHRLQRRLAWGGVLSLRHADAAAGEQGYALHLGVQLGSWRRSEDAGALRLDAGAVLENAVRPQATGSDASRRFLAGVALQRHVRPDLRLGVALGCAATAERGGATAGVTLGLGSRFDLAAGLGDGFARAGAALHLASWRFDYVLEAASPARHALALRRAWGPTAAERRARSDAAEAEARAKLVEEAVAALRSQRVGAEIDAGERELAAHDFDAAAERSRIALLWGPEEQRAHDGLRRARRGAFLARADSLVQREDLWAASHLLDQAQAALPVDSTIAARLAGVRESIGQAHRTRSEAAEQFRLGLDAYAAQRFVQASRCFDAVLTLDPGHAAAAEFLARSRQAHSEQVRNALALAHARLKKRDYDAAEEALQAVLAAEPEHAEALEVQAKVARAREQRQNEQRLAAARQAEASVEDRSPAMLSPAQLREGYAHGMSLYRAGDLLGAMRAWEHVAAAEPEYAEVGQYLLRVYRVVGLESYTEGHLQEAIEIWGKALHLEPGNQQVRRYLNQANAKLRRAQGPEGGLR